MIKRDFITFFLFEICTKKSAVVHGTVGCYNFVYTKKERAVYRTCIQYAVLWSSFISNRKNRYFYSTPKKMVMVTRHLCVVTTLN
jgi:hypothetical protein